MAAKLADSRKKVTIQDIARRANVSITTVSRVLNQKGYVAETKRHAVLKAVSDLDYRPNVFAQGLAGGNSLTIGILTQAISSPIYDLIIRGVLEGLEGSSYFPLMADGNWIATKERDALKTFVNRAVDGLIILGGNLPDQELIDISQEVPLIAIARDIPELGSRSIKLDDFQGAYEATRYLIDSGHRRIAHISGISEHKDALQRRQGYLNALEEAGISPDPDLIVEGDYTEPSGFIAAEMLMLRGRPFSAVFAANDQMAYGVRLALYRRGMRVPEEISLVGYDDQATSAYMTPPLTTIRLPALEIGAAAAQGIINLIKGKPCQLPSFSPNLIIRESVSRH
jgi:LacI family transcriptional regulator